MTATTIKWIGWAGVDDGVSKWVYSTDGGNTWKDASGSAITITDSKMLEVINGAGLTNATAKGSFASSGIVADLSDLSASTVEVIFAAVPIADTTKVIPMVKIINVNILNTCSHSNVASWSPVEGQLKECGVCAGCGETVERDTTFVVCVDKVVYAGGTRAWKANSAGSNPYVVADVEIMQADINGITVQGWVGINGGVSKYMWSIDGVNWQDAGTGYYSNTGIPGAINGFNTGISNFTTNCQFNLQLKGLLSLESEFYTVYIGVVPQNNPTVVVPIVQLNNVAVPK